MRIRTTRALALCLLVGRLGSAVPAAAQPFVAAHGLSAADYQAYIDQAVRRHLRPRRLDVATVNRAPVFSVILEPWAPDDLAKAGFRPVPVSAYEAGGQALFAAVWHYDKNAIYFGRHGMTSDEFQQAFDAFAASSCSTRISVDLARGELVDLVFGRGAQDMKGGEDRG